MYNAGLVLEGGGMRGIYTAGVLDFFLDKGIDFSSCYGVSAGSCHACSYLSKQRGRAYKACADYIHDKHYCSYYSLITTGDMFGEKLVYDDIPNKLLPYDYDAYLKSETKFYAVLTNVNTGKAEYHQIKDMRKDLIRIRASSSLPMLARNVSIDGEIYLDGGISDSIPLKKSVEDGNMKNVVVLTQCRDYRKGANKMMPIIKMKYRKNTEFVQMNADRHIKYNETLDYIKAEEEAGNTFVIAPKAPVEIGRLEKDTNKLFALYKLGYDEAEERFDELMSFLEK